MKRVTYEQEQNKYRLKDGIGFLHPFEDAINLLGQYEELFTKSALTLPMPEGRGSVNK